MIVIGGHLNSGIGQHAFKYTKLFDSASYYFIGCEIPESDDGLIFLLPLKPHIEYLKYARTRVKNLAIMTVCETETVHEDYGMIMKETKRVRRFRVSSVSVSYHDSFQITSFTLFTPIFHHLQSHIHFIILEIL
jgi:hypothetical protein